MRRRRRSGIAVFTMLAAAEACVSEPISRPQRPPLPEGVFMSVRELTYPVRGRTMAGIGRSLEHSGPMWDRRIVQGLTTWRVGWQGRSTMDEGTCRLVNLRVLLEVEIILPEWKDHDAASPTLVLAWDAFEAALRGHEYGHRNLGMQSAVEVLQVLRAAATPDCLGMDALADSLAGGIVRKYERRTDAYERDTQRGRTEGAVWPPGG